MIVEYHRPTSLEEAMALLRRSEPRAVPLGGGTALNRPSSYPVAVVDLQALGLNTFEQQGSSLSLGATLTLQALLENLKTLRLSNHALADAMRKAITHEATYNLRHAATVAGTIVAADGRSPLTTLMLALDSQLTILPEEKTSGKSPAVGLGDLLPLREERLKGRLITRASISTKSRAAYEYVARSPADLPIVCAAAAAWPSGRTRVALGGFGESPALAFDGPDADGAEIAARSAYSQAGDEWASSEYRGAMAGVLTRRCLEKLVS